MHACNLQCMQPACMRHINLHAIDIYAFNFDEKKHDAFARRQVTEAPQNSWPSRVELFYYP